MLRLELLGPPIVRFNGQDITGQLRHSSQCLLFYLALNDHPQSRIALAHLLWPRLAPAYGYGNLRESLHHLRKAVEECGCLIVDRRTLALDQARCEVADVAALRTLPDLRAAQAPIADIEARLAQYRGDFLMGWRMPDSPTYTEWVMARRLEFQRLAQDGLAGLAERHLASGDYPATLRATQRGLEMQPQDEVMMRLLMQALAQSGQRLSALEAYEQFRQTLADRFKIAPSPELETFARQLRQGEAPPKAAPDPKPVTPAGNLPRSLTPFFGRQAEMAQLRDWLRQPDYGLITLTGPGGVGKTRLALEAGRAMQSHFTDGVWHVPLTYVDPGHDPEQAVLRAMAAAVDLQPGRSALRDQVIARFRGSRALLILDGFDAMLKAGPFLIDLLQAAHGVRLLVTSRERLDLLSEQPLVLNGLCLPDPEAADADAEQSPAVELLVERARRAAPWFRLTAASRSAAVAICHQLDGLPLALELAAAQLASLQIEELARDLRQSALGLQADRPDLQPHQRGLARNLDLSWQRLTPAQQRALCACAVFQGGFDRAAAAAVARVDPEDLQALTARSLVAKVDGGRYDLHPLIREYAQTRSAEVGVNLAALRRQHAAYYADLFIARMPDLTSDPSAMREMASDQINLRAAWRELLTARDLERIRRGLPPLVVAFGLQAASQLSDLMWQVEAALRTPAPGESDRERQRALGVILGWLSQFVERQGDLDRAQRLAEEAIALGEATGDEELQANGNLRMAGLLFAQDNLPGSRAATERGLEKARRIDHPLWQCVGLCGLAIVLDSQHGNLSEIIALYQEAMKQARRAREHRQVMTIGYNLGNSYLRRGDVYAARQVELEALELAQAFGSVMAGCWLNNGLGRAELHLGRQASARGYSERGLQVALAINDVRWQMNARSTLAALEAQQSDFPAMRLQLEQAERAGKPTQFKNLLSETARHLGHLELALGNLDAADAAFQRSLELMPDEQPADEMLVVIRLGLRALLRCRQGRLPEAVALAEAALPRLSALYFSETSPLFTYRNLWEVLRTAGDPRAPGLLAEARDRLLAWADLIPDPEFRRGFLEDVPLNREILASADAPNA